MWPSSSLTVLSRPVVDAAYRRAAKGRASMQVDRGCRPPGADRASVLLFGIRLRRAGYGSPRSVSPVSSATPRSRRGACAAEGGRRPRHSSCRQVDVSGPLPERRPTVWHARQSLRGREMRSGVPGWRGSVGGDVLRRRGREREWDGRLVAAGASGRCLEWADGSGRWAALRTAGRVADWARLGRLGSTVPRAGGGSGRVKAAGVRVSGQRPPLRRRRSSGGPARPRGPGSPGRRCEPWSPCVTAARPMGPVASQRHRDVEAEGRRCRRCGRERGSSLESRRAEWVGALPGAIHDGTGRRHTDRARDTGAYGARGGLASSPERIWTWPGRGQGHHADGGAECGNAGASASME